MPTYRITAPDGRTIRLTGDTPPTESELEDIFLRVRNDVPGQHETPTLDQPAPSQWTEPVRGLQRGVIGAEIAGQTMMAASQGDRLRTLAESIRAKSGFQQHDSLSPVFGNQQEPTPQPKSAADIATLTAQQEAVQKLEDSIGERARQIASLQAERDSIPKSEAMQGFDDPENWWKAWLANPVEVTATLMTENLPQMVPGMVAGAAAGSALGPVGTAIGAGSGSLAVEYANGILDALDEEGVDVRNAGALTEAFLDPAKMASAKARALKGGIPVAAWDAVSGGVAGRFVRPVIGKGLGPVVRRSLAEAAAQGAMGGAGEISKAIALEKPINWRDVAAEVVLELPGGAVEVATNIRESLDGRTRQKAAEAQQKTPKLPETAAGGTGGMIPVGPVKEPEQPKQPAATQPAPQPPPAPPTQPGDPGTRVRFETSDGKSGELTLPPGADPQPALEMLKRTQPGHKISSIETVAPKEVIADEGQTQEQDQEGQVLGTETGVAAATAEGNNAGAAASPTDAVAATPEPPERYGPEDYTDPEPTELAVAASEFDAPMSQEEQDAARAELDQELGQTDEQPAIPEPEPAAQPQPASPEQVKPEPFKKNAIVWVGFRKNGRHIHKAKVNAVDGEFVTVYLFKKKQYVTLPAGQVSLPASVQGRKNYEAQFAGMSPAERKRAKADSKAFDDLVRNEGWRFDWYDPRVEQGTGAKEEELRQAAALQAARRKAFAALGAANLAPNDPVERAKLLTKLRQYVEQSIPEAERQQADFRSATAAGGQEVSASELAVGDMLDIEGEQVAVTAVDPDTGGVTLQDGRRFGTQTLADGDSIWIEKLDKPSASPDEAFRLTDTRKPITTPANERQRTIQDAAIVSWAKDKLGAIARGMRPARVPGNRVGAGAVPQSGARSGVPAGSGPGLLRALEQVFGVRIVLVESEDGRPLPFHGVVPERGRRVILIDANLDKPLPTIAGHEILHTIRSADPKLYADLVEALREMMPGAPDYKAKLDAVRKRYGMQPSTLDLAEEELVADFLGDSLTDPAFWSQLEQQDRGLFRRVAQAVKRWLDAIAQKVAGLTDYNSRQYFSDIERARRVLVDAVKQYASNVAAGRYGDADTFVASNATITAPAVFSIRAYHGTPHKVDKFTTAKIGTGEGAQVYGWGLYFAQEKKVAEEYSKNLGKEILLDGKPIFSTSSKAYIHNGLGSAAMSALLSSNGDVDAAIREVKRDYPTDLNPVRQLEGVRGRISVNASGRTYTVNLNVEDDELLDWDKPLSEQPEAVRRYAQELLNKRDISERLSASGGPVREGSAASQYRPTWKPSATGADFNKALRDILGPKAASDALAAIGIRGIRYLDQGSRQNYRLLSPKQSIHRKWTVGDPSGGPDKFFDTEQEARAYMESAQRTHNFVIFDESAIEIVAENGQAITPTEAFSLRDSKARLRRTRAQLLADIRANESWRDWYDRHNATLREVFGDDAQLFKRLLAATSQNATVKSNITYAIKAFGQLKRGEPFVGFMRVVIKNLERIRLNEEVGGRKIQNYSKAVVDDDPDAVVIDRHMVRHLFRIGDNAPTKAQYDRAEAVIRELAQQIGWKPREVQAALWAARIRETKKPVEDYEQHIRKLAADGTIEQRLAGADWAGSQRNRAGGTSRPAPGHGPGDVRFSLREADAELTRLRRKQNRTAADNARITELQAQLGQQDLFAVPTKPVAEIEREKQRLDVAEGAARRLVADPLVTQKEMFGKPGQQELFSLRAISEPNSVSDWGKETRIKSIGQVEVWRGQFGTRRYIHRDDSGAIDSALLIGRRTPRDRWQELLAYTREDSRRRGLARLLTITALEDVGSINPASEYTSDGAALRSAVPLEPRFSLRDIGGHLVAIHNTTADKIRHMLKMGGLAVPSVAVARTDKGFASFGDISLVAPPHMVTPSSTTKVLNADAYSPRYPTVNYRLDAPSERKVGAFIKSKLDALPDDKRKSFSHYTALGKVESEGLRGAMLDSESVKAAFLVDTGRIGSVEWEPVPQGSERYASSYDRTSIIKAVSPILDEFKQWVDDTIGKLDVNQQERIFNGYTNGGDRRYLKHDLDTVVRIMKKGFRDAEGFNYGVGSVRAKVAKQFRSLADIKGNRDKIVTSQEMDATKQAVDAEFIALSEKALPLRTGGKNDGFGALDAFSDDLKALAEGGQENMRHLRQMYPAAQPFDEMRAFLSKLRDLPSEYFEAKVQRAVQMSEFIGAAVPDGTAKDIITELQRFGLKVKTYPKGDETARMQAVQEIGDEGNALFSLRNEQARRDQAGNLDTPLAARWIAGGLRILQSLPAGSMFSAWKAPFLAEFPDAKPWVNQTWTRVRQAEAQEARFSLSPQDDRGTTPPVKAGDPAGQSSQSATPKPGQGVVTPQLEAAYKMGLEEGAKWGRSLQKFDAFANQGEAEYPPFFDVLADPRALFWQAGFVGSGVPKWVRAFRIGKLPTDGTSTNFRDGHREKGVSVLYIEGEKRSDVGTFDLLNPGDLVAVEGWRHYETGSDGEPLLVGAVPSQQSFSLRDPSDGSQFSLSGDAQAAVNRIEAEASHASEAAKAASEPPPVYDPERVTRWWHHLLRPSDVITLFGADGLLKKKHGLELATAYQAAAVKKERDNLREQLEESLYAADPKLKTWPKWARWIWPKTRLREFMQIALPTAAHMQVVDGEPGDWEFADFEMRAGTLSEAAAKKMGASPGSTINTANPITGVAETLVVGSLIDLENGRKVYQLFRPMKAETQRQVYDYVRAKYPEFTWLIDLWVTPRMKDARVTINGVEIPIFNRFSLAAKYSEGDPTFQWRQAYTPDVALSNGIIGSVRRFVQRKRLNLRAGVESPGRKYETGAARESGNVMDLLSGWSTRTFQVLQEQERKTWMQEVLGTAADIPNQSRIEDVPDGWMVIDDAMNALWRAFQGLRKTDRSAFPQTADRLADDNSPEYQAFFGEVMRLRGKPKMLPEILVKSLIGRMSAQEEHGRLMKLAQWWGRNWKAALLLMPDTWLENRTDNYLRLIMAGHRQLTAALLSGGDKLAFREARNLAWAGLANLIPGVRQAFRLNHQSLFKRLVEERLPEDVFGGNTRLRDLQLLERGTRDEIRSLLDQGKKARAVGKVVAEAGPMALEAVGYGNLDIAGKQQFAFSTLLAKAQTLARRKGLRGEDMSRFVEEWMLNAPDAEVRRAVEGANRWLLNYGDTPNWVHTLARHPVSNLLVAFPLFRYHFVGREIDRATAALRGLHKSLIRGKKLTKAEKVAAWADTISYVTMPAMGYAVASVIGALKDSVIAPALEGPGGDDDEDPRAVVGSSVQLVEDDGKLVRKPLPREIVTANRLNISHLLRSFGMETGGDSDYWWHFKDYPIVRSAAAFYQAAEDAKKHGVTQGLISMQGMMMDMLSSLAGTGQAVKVPAKVLAEIESASSGRPAFTQWDPYATGVSLPAYLTMQALNLVPFQRQANEVLKWIDPTPRRVRSSKTLDYEAGALEALQAEGWTGLMDRMLRGGESTLPPQGTIDRRRRMVLTPRQHTLAERIAGLMGQNIKTVERNRYRNAIED